MPAMIRLPITVNSGKGEYCWAKSKVLEDGTKELIGFIAADEESKYPDGEISDGFYYERCFSEDQTVYLLKLSETESVYAQLSGNETVELTATVNDIRLGTTAVINSGVVEGEKDIPAFQTLQGTKLIRANDDFVVSFTDDRYDYTQLQAMTAPFNSTFSESVAVDRVVINESVYAVKSADAISTVIKDDANKTINLGITNGELPYVIRYITYREEL